MRLLTSKAAPREDKTQTFQIAWQLTTECLQSHQITLVSGDFADVGEKYGEVFQLDPFVKAHVVQQAL